ncbi:hypothetical protein Drorol1_Dr00007755 [Drosera rotundifolia]
MPIEKLRPRLHKHESSKAVAVQAEIDWRRAADGSDGRIEWQRARRSSGWPIGTRLAAIESKAYGNGWAEARDDTGSWPLW